MHLRADKLRCSQPSARADELDELVWNEVVRHLDNPELILRSCATPAASTLTADATRQLTDLRSQQARLIDAYQAGVISLRDLEARRRPVTDRITELEQITRQAERHRTSKAELQQRIDAFASQIADGLATMDFNRRQQLVRTVIDKVIVSESRVEILFNIPLPGTPKEGRSPATRVNQLRPQRQCGYELRDCWPSHIHAIWELSTLAAAWHHAYGGQRPNLVRALEFYDRWLPSAMRRIGAITRGCVPECATRRRSW